MSERGLTDQELALVRVYVEMRDGLAADRQDVWRARIARATGGRFRKLGTGLYEIIPDRRTML
ncbi:hypothetical protein AB0D08_39860 [Kitasatospora sp. NPDC048540]|uniref:hypothetical protein n=1 Tax=unclassified Kitasatospora TaxID=2633591 RepID=UPI000539893A|nr:hypothetical protein [Kitasatospora sp. MBT63]